MIPNLGTVVLRGHSGQAYDFRVWPVGTKFASVGAVCVFTKRTFGNRNYAKRASHECIHIGETRDLSRLSYDERYTGGADCVCVHLLKDPAQRVEVERDLAESLGIWNQAFRVELDLRKSGDVAALAPAARVARDATPAGEAGS